MAKWQQRVIDIEITEDDLERYSIFEPRNKFDLLLVDE